MAKKVQLMTNAKQWQVVDGVEVLVDVPQEDIDPIIDSSCVEIEGYRTLEETINQENMFTPEIVETKVRSKVGGVYHDNVVDGAYEEAILYGNTQVNLVESITSGTKYIPHSFTSFQGNESKIGNYNSGRTNQVAPLIKGVTMVNLVQEGSMTLEGGTALIVHNVKGNTEYTLKFTFTQKNSMASIVVQSYKDENGTLTYLENSKLQSGLGDEVAITFTTHEQANRIHICNSNEYGGETIQLDNIMVIEGDVTDLNLPFFKGMRSVELSRPLTNLFTDDLKWGNQGTITYTNSSGNVTVTSKAIQTWAGITFYLGTLKQNTKYLVMWDSLTQTQTSTSSSSIIAVYDVSSNTNIGTANSKTECPTLRSIVFNTTGRDYTNIGLRVHATLTNSETGTTTVKGLRVFEWDDSLRTLDLQTIGYFSGTKYVSARTLETEGKNLYPYGDIRFTPTMVGWCDGKGTNYMYLDIASKSKTRFLLKKGTYILSGGTEKTNVEAWGITDDKNTSSIYSGQKFTVNQDTFYSIIIKTLEANVETNIKNIQIERGETATSYEAYQSRYYKPKDTEEIILRSLPNGVCDTFNLQTGELVQNIGETVLDGSSDETWHYLQSGQNGLRYFRVIMQDMFIDNDQGYMPTYFINDKYNIVNYNRLFLDKDVPNSILISSTYSTSTLAQCIFIYHNSIGDIPSFKTWLKQNPITVQYILKEPIITKLQTYNRVYSGQTNALANMGNNLSALTYYSNNYCLKVGNLSPVPAILEPITTIPYDVRLKPSTLYTVKYNRGGNSNSMKFDLGGSVVEKINATDLGIVAEEFTVRTPAILSHEQIRLSGTGYAHNFIVVEGDITGTELPFFEGMKDVKMPIVKNTNSDGTRVNSVYAVQGEYPITNEMIEQGGFSASLASTYENMKYDNAARLRSKELIPVKPNTTYAFAHSFSKFAYNVYQWNGNKKFIDGVSRYFASGQIETITTTADTQYIHFLMSKHDASQAITVAEYDWSQFHMYELDSTINLRSLPNGVKDELNLLTGEYIQRVGEVVLDGSEGWRVGQAEIGEMAYFMTDNYYPQSIKLNTTTLKLTTQAYGYPNVAFTDVWHERQEGLSSSNGKPGIRAVSNTYSTVEEWKAFLQSNPITVQYELAEPIISHVRLVSNNQEREVGVKLPNGVCNTYNPSIGITTVRVGKIVLDGSEDWFFDTTKTNTQVFGLVMSDMATTQNNLYCETMRVASGVDAEIIATASGVLFIALLKTKASTVDELKTYLASNPITVWYQLKYPQIQPDIVLPNGVHDEYNPETGVYTKKVGFIELDGSTDEKWVWGEVATGTNVNTQLFLSPCPQAQTIPTKIECNIICDKLSFLYELWDTDQEGIHIFANTTHIAIRVTKSKLTEVTTFGLKQYLSQNPLKVWYELATPITYQLTPYFGLPQPYAYEDGYLIHDSAYAETTLPPEFKYKLVANRTGQVMQNSRKLQEHTTRLSDLEALIIEATIESLFNRELQLFELELMDIQLIDLGE